MPKTQPIANKPTPPHGLPCEHTVENHFVWCTHSATDLRPYGLTKQSRFVDCLKQRGFFRQVALRRKVFFK